MQASQRNHFPYVLFSYRFVLRFDWKITSSGTRQTLPLIFHLWQGFYFYSHALQCNFKFFQCHILQVENVNCNKQIFFQLFSLENCDQFFWEINYFSFFKSYKMVLIKTQYLYSTTSLRDENYIWIGNFFQI